ncbi:hypothetical protein LPB136_05855 [Tenacibaculum todarodis]|uniref:Ig-like domain-containing protein n=1 Tax=Tenacibaculum todarodis TaxID=1850252 RepID=A0A1L3JIE6_9FLAO|nr:T9SS type B sorting domain-containing protein [Tenacibaculum todarodis]APG64911.1 hypothetical protein LPB136_05855 [Tenacibaculum todarodis]
MRKNNFILIVLMLLFSWNINSQNNGSPTCEGANPMCSDNNGVKIFPNVTGNSGTASNPTPAYGCLNDSPNAAWFYIKIGQAGDLNFQIVQNTLFDSNGNPIGTALDVDFVAWGPFNTPDNNCNSLSKTCITGTCPDNVSNPGFYLNNLDGTNIVDCSWSTQTEESFTITNTQQGEFYILLVTNWTPAGTAGTPGFIKLEQTNFGVAGAGVTDCSIIAGELGEDQIVCEGTQVELDATPSAGTAISYEWLLDTGSGFNTISGETNATISITTNISGTYQVKIIDEVGNEATDEVEITFVPPPTATQPAPIEICDTDGAGYSFDLTTQTTTIIGTQTGVDVKYYITEADANVNSGEITNFDFTTNTVQQIWARVFNSAIQDNLSCDTVTNFEIRYSVEPTPETASDIIVCDDTTSSSATDGIFTFDQFIDKDVEILGNLSTTEYSVSYHTTQTGAQTDATTDVIDKNTAFTNTTTFNQEIFVRVENIINPSCAVDQSFFLRVLDLPVANPVSTIEKCDATGGTSTTFNFDSEATPQVLLTQSTTNFEVLYFETAQAAIDNVAGTNITGNYTNTAANQTIYVRIHNVSNPDLCPQFTDFQITVFSTPILNTTFEDTTHCENDTFNITIDSTADTFIWQVSTDNGANWNDVVADANYSNETSTALTITDAPSSFNTNQYRVRMFRTGSSCESTSNAITLTLNSLPVLNSIELKQCDDDTDGFSAFNLTEANALISSNYTNETFVYYSDAAYTSVITNDTAYTNTNTPNDIVYVRVTNNTTLCASDIAVNLLITASQVPDTFSENLTMCDDYLDINGNDNANNDDTDGITTFNFEYVRATIEAMFTTQVVTVTFYRNEADALSEANEIVDATNYRNIGYPNMQQIYVRVDNNLDNGCLGLGPYINLTVDTVPVANTINIDNEYELCDDFNDSDDANGIIQSFDLEGQTAAILGTQDPTNFTVTYHESQAEATSGANALTSPYENTVANQQPIYVRITNNTTMCAFDRYTFNLVVNTVPIANSVEDLEICDDDTDGISQNFDLELQTSTILGTQDPANFTVTYHTSLALAQSGAMPITGLFTNTTPNRQTIYTRIEDNTSNCVNASSNFDVIVNPEPLGNPDNNSLDLIDCDTETGNGIIDTIDLESQIPLILGDATVQDPNDFNVTFHLSQADAISGDSPQSTPFTNTNAFTQTIFVRIENKTTFCVNDDVTFDIIINPIPDFEVTTPRSICLNDPQLTLEVENPNGSYSYQWLDPNGNALGTGETQNVTTGGDYSVTATTISGTMCSRTRTITVTESNIATITDDDISIIDDTSNNSITINNENNNLGEGDYEFALVNENGLTIANYQDSPVFEGLEGGIYTIHIRDKNGCGEITHTVAVVEFPKFFTPNNDGIKDTWIIKGVNTTFYPENSVVIYNRQGKVINEFSFSSQGWNGYYKNKPMPSNDYWFKATLIDTKGIVRTRSGHFSLIRR